MAMPRFPVLVACLVILGCTTLGGANRQLHGLLTAAEASQQDPSGSQQLNGVYMWRGNPSRTGVSNNEQFLRPDNVSPTTFGKLWSYPVDGQVYAQPLYVWQVQVPGSQQPINMLYVATENNTVAAYNADTNDTNPVWSRNLGQPVFWKDLDNCPNIMPWMGITSTPVIDPESGTIYIVANSKDENCTLNEKNQCRTVYWDIHALDFSTGESRPNSPQRMEASTANASFDGIYHLNRAGLVLCGGVVYVAFASHCDIPPYWGWVFAYNASSLELIQTWLTTPDDQEAGIWMSGGAAPYDDQCNQFYSIANGLYDGTGNFGNSVVKLSPATAPNGMQVQDWFTPDDQEYLSSVDLDVGASAPIFADFTTSAGSIIQYVLQVGKNGQLYIMNRTHLGHYAGDPEDTDANTVQEVDLRTNEDLYACFSSPAVFNNRMYMHMFQQPLNAYEVLPNGTLPSTYTMTTNVSFSYPGAQPTISALAGTNGIVWEVNACVPYSFPPVPDTCSAYNAAVLYAWDAETLEPLYNSTINPKDELGVVMKFIQPTVVNGKVYIPGENHVTVYGLFTQPQ